MDIFIHTRECGKVLHVRIGSSENPRPLLRYTSRGLFCLFRLALVSLSFCLALDNMVLIYLRDDCEFLRSYNVLIQLFNTLTCVVEAPADIVTCLTVNLYCKIAHSCNFLAGFQVSHI